MGDKSPKSTNKKSKQHDAKSAATKKQKKAIQDAKHVAPAPGKK
ncbi:hypothetical protein [Rubricoccus marinus]|nr:hypothetical protein [Rubricoccus marinus]